ncbi:MAG: sigma 54-interacting transcriptional regulator [Myxococcota bacterium]
MNPTLSLPDPATTRARLEPRLRQVFRAGRVVPDVSWRVPEGATLLGREEGAERTFVQDDPTVSRAHARLVRAGDTVRVEELAGSKNGMWVDGHKVREAELVDGAVVRIGGTLLVFRRVPVPLDDVVIPGLRGTSPEMAALRVTLARAATMADPVLLLGETGTGKTAAAACLHRLSGRPGAFVPVNVAAVPEALAEAALFGHTAHAFTGAQRESAGHFRAADRGTLLLDEIGEIEARLQARLLHAVEAREVMPVGASRPQPIDVRVVAATNVDLVAAVRDGRFRADLYARLAGLVIALPPLRARRDDILALLAPHLPPGVPLSPALAERLVLHPWPFNVREVERVAAELRFRAPDVTVLDVPLVDARLSAFATEAAAPPPDSADAGPPDRDRLVELLTRHDGVVAAVARAVQRTPRQVYRWLEREGIDPEGWRKGR